jgi:coenzyme F420 hydrogenase subunit beta
MANRWKYNWHDLVEQVIDTERCTGCSGCVVACPKKVLHLDRGSWTPRLDSEAWSEDRAGYCSFGERGCTLCTRACPRFGSWENDADLELWSRTRRVEEVLGVHRRILMVEATDRAIAAAGQDGGLGTAILLYALDKGYIDGALVSQYDDEMKTQPGIASTRDELLACAGSRYTYSPNLLALEQADREMKLGVVSVGCQVSVPAVARSRGANKLAKRFGLVVGLLCSKTFDDGIYEDLLEASYGVGRQSITKVNIKGRLQVWYGDGEDEPSYLEVPLSRCKKFSRQGCSHCPDFAAQHADVSLGGIGSQAGRTLTISRSELGDEILYDMEYDGLITVSDAVTEDPDAVALIEKLAVLQRERWLGDPPASESVARPSR